MTNPRVESSRSSSAEIEPAGPTAAPTPAAPEPVGDTARRAAVCEPGLVVDAAPQNGSRAQLDRLTARLSSQPAGAVHHRSPLTATDSHRALVREYSGQILAGKVPT